MVRQNLSYHDVSSVEITEIKSFPDSERSKFRCLSIRLRNAESKDWTEIMVYTGCEAELPSLQVINKNHDDKRCC